MSGRWFGRFYVKSTLASNKIHVELNLFGIQEVPKQFFTVKMHSFKVSLYTGAEESRLILICRRKCCTPFLMNCSNDSSNRGFPAPQKSNKFEKETRQIIIPLCFT
jgi:hypothetical protein